MTEEPVTATKDKQPAVEQATTPGPAWMRRGEGFVEWTSPFAESWPPRAQWLAPDPLADPATTTVLDTFLAHVQSQPQKDCLGWRELDTASQQQQPGKLGPFRWLSWAEAGARVAAIGSGLAGLGLTPPGSRVGLFAPNCPDWTLCEYASFRQGLTVVPVYPTCGAGTIDTIVRHSELALVFCHTTLLAALLEDLSSTSAPPIRVIVLIGNGVDTSTAVSGLPESARSTLASINARVIPLAELIAAGTATPAPATPSKPADVFSIVYTSGSEGQPKGVVLTHQGVMAAVENFAGYPGFAGPTHEFTYFSYLPLAHVFEREVLTVLFRSGARVGFSSGLANLVEDMGLLKPDFIVGVPRVWKRVYEKVNQTVARQSFLKRAIFNLAVSRKMAAVRSGNASWVPWDSLVLHSVAEKLGGNMKFVINGAAAADPELSLWFQAVFNVRFYQGYGLTETFAAVAVQHQGCDADKSSIGPPIPTMVARLADVPDMGYFAADNPPRGEIWLKGPMVTREYYNNPEATAAAFREEGFFATGDIGRLNPDGTITIIDRKKNLFKLAQGEYVALEYVETVYGRCKEVAQVWVWGDPLANFLVSVVVPNFDVLRAALKDAGIADLPESNVALCIDARVRKFVLDKMDAAATQAKLMSFQRIKALMLEPEAWTIEANQLTPTFKLRRTELSKKYSSALTALCAEHKAALATSPSLSPAPAEPSKQS